MKRRAILLWWSVLSLPVAAEEIMPDSLPTIDAPHDYLATRFVGLFSDIDRFFGDDRHYQEGNQSVLQLDLTRVTGYSGNRQIALSGKAKIDLPNTSKRLHLLIESNPDKNPGSEPAQNTLLNNNVATPNSYAAAVRYEKQAETRWFFSTDAGVKFQGLNSSLFTRARASYTLPLEQWRLKFSESPFWFNTLGVGSSSQLDLERALSEPLLFRASSNATWLRDKHNFDLRQDLSFYHTLNDRTALLYQASAIGVSQPQVHATDYVLLVLYRYRLHQKWMYFEISPQMHYPLARNYQPSPMLSLRLEVLFDQPR